MVTDTLKKKLASGQTVYGPFADFCSADIVEVFGLAGFDFTVIDCEHSTCSLEQAVHMIRAASGQGMPAMVRVPNALPSTILKHLDIGSAGIMVPLVHTPELARQIAGAARYHPFGKRGYAGARSGAFGFISVADHIKRCNENTFVQVQAESVQAVENIKEIVAVDGVDSVFIGTFDLSQSLGIPGQVNDQREVDLIKRTVEAVRGAGKIAGIYAGTIENAQRYVEMGFQFIVYSGDLCMLAETCAGTIKALRAIK